MSAFRPLHAAAAAGACAAALSAAAHAVPVTVTVTNEQAEGGLSLTPLWLAFFDGQSFDAFDAGEAATQGVEDIAELGVASTIRDELLAAQADSQGGLITAPGGFPGAPIIEPGETVSVTFDVDPESQGWVQFLSMILPSNDNFVGLDDAVRLFAEDGSFLGPQSFSLTSEFAFDAGTEVNDLSDGPAFVAGQVDTDGTPEGGVVTQSVGIAVMGQTIMLPDGSLLSSELAQAFFGGQTTLATVSFALADADAVPLPGAALLFGTVLAGAGARRLRRG